jgi:hypothetical protein
MEIIKLVVATILIFLLIVGGLTLALTRRRKRKHEGDCNTPFYEESAHPSCGCGSGACGLPTETSKE